MDFFDPYYTKDPTIQHDGFAAQGRSIGGKYTIKSVLNTMVDDNFPINSVMWQMYARGALKKVIALRGEKFAYKVLSKRYIPRNFLTQKIGKNTRFSFRMICEMFEVASDSILEGKSDTQAIELAHQYLKDKQGE